jgi:anti-sigma regulatory factor (Ser/Thr protein kinase)
LGKAPEIDMAGDNMSSHAREREGRRTDSGQRELPGKAMAAVESDIRLTLPARAENVAVVRHALGALAEALDLPGALIEDIRLAVTEACTNVVRHAYIGVDGTIEVVVRPRGSELEVVVEDSGRGIGLSPDTAGPGLGLPLIAALADTLEIERSATAGSRLVMSFMRARDAPAMGLA